jgi:NADPH-dependent glutamate synthase beta subunit-like oxidoreductase/ferredoxin
MIKLTIDSRAVEVPEGTTLLAAARKSGVDIPTLCYLEGHAAPTSCYLCVVRVQGRPRLLPACATAALEGMVVESETDEVREARRTAIELLLSDHLGDCVAPCQGTCPAHIDIPTMVRHISAGRMREALIVVKRSVALPGVLGYICPELCEKGCRRKAKDESVAICNLKRYVAEEDLASEAPYLPVMKPDSGKKVAIVGAGPAGLSAAYYLRVLGHACTVFDEHEEAGGMLRYGVLEKDLPRKVLDEEVAVIRSMGVSFSLGSRVGREVSFAELRSSFNAVLVAVGDVKEAEAPSTDLERSANGLKADRETMMSNLPGVFLAGSAVTPAKHAVRAVADGRNAAERIDAFLLGRDGAGAEKEFSVHVGKLDAESVSPFMQLVNSEGRIEAAATGFLPEQARREAQRCIQCGCVRPEACRLRRYAGEYGAVQARFKGERREFSQDATHPDVIFEPGKCIACGICVRIAAAAGEKLGLGFVGRGFTVRTSVPFSESLREGLRETARECAVKCPTGALILREWLEETP